MIKNEDYSGIEFNFFYNGGYLTGHLNTFSAIRDDLRAREGLSLDDSVAQTREIMKRKTSLVGLLKEAKVFLFGKFNFSNCFHGKKQDLT